MADMENLSQKEVFRVCSLFDDALEKLALLGSITPDIMRHREALSQIVGEEISSIIHEQRQLEMKYEGLVEQQAVLKGLSNRSKYNENQRELAAVSQLLRQSTKRLCRNLQENPNFAGNLVKIQSVREKVIQILNESIIELRKQSTVSTLKEFVSEGKRAHASAHEIRVKERDTLDDIKRLTMEYTREKAEFQKENSEQRSTLSALKQQLVDAKAKTHIDITYARNESRAKRSSTTHLYNQIIQEQDAQIKKLQIKTQLGERVHCEAVNFLKEKQESLQAQLNHWNLKHQQDTLAKRQELLLAQQQQAEMASKLEKFQARWNDEKQKMKEKEQEYKRLLAAEALRKEELKVQNIAARLIQASIRAYILRKLEKKKVTELTTKKAKKGKAGKKK